MGSVSVIYDELFQFEAKKKSESYPIHKRLNLEKHDDLIDWLIDKVGFDNQDDVWDAGCGVGYSLMKLGSLIRSGYGCSLSQPEIEFAQDKAKSQVFGKKLLFEQSSFENPQSRQYSKVLMIESLKHTTDLDATLDNILASLSPNGQLIIADDFTLVEDISVQNHRKLWAVPNFCSLEHLSSMIESKGDFKINTTDFTEGVPVRNGLKLRAFIALLEITLRLGISQSQNIKTYLGALLLERLYLRKQANYTVIIAQRIG